MEDLGQTVPNLTFSENNQSITVAIRGISPDTVIPSADPAVALHVDGVYQPRLNGMSFLMNDLEAVEVLRGRRARSTVAMRMLA